MVGGSANTAGCFLASGHSGGEREGGWGSVPGVWSSGVRRLSVELASCSFGGKTGEKLEKEVEREVGTLDAWLLDVLWGAGLPASGAVLAGAGLLWEGGVSRTILTRCLRLLGWTRR